MQYTLNLIGAGRLGQTLARLFHEQRLLTLQSVCNQSLTSAEASCHFIGSGTPVSSLTELPPADITLLAVPDNQIELVCQTWVRHGLAAPKSILFHASGALSSARLKSAADAGVYTASVHPMKSFAHPEQAYQTFKGTFCAIEGNDHALQILIPLFKALGADLGSISAETKTLYHAACVMACGGLTALYASVGDLLQEAGLNELTVQKILAPYMKETLDNNMMLGSAKALTGPVARGDSETVLAHTQALGASEQSIQDLYRVLSVLQENIKKK